MAKGMCKACYANDYYWNKPGEKEKNRTRALQWTRNNKQRILSYYKDKKYEVLSHYSEGVPKCACCGEATFEFLTLDHINGGGNKHRAMIGSGRWFYSWVRTNNYPPLFQVLCMNCNFAKGVHGMCPHNKDGSQIREMAINSVGRPTSV